MRSTGGVGKLLVVGLACALAVGRFGPIGCIFVGVVLLMLAG